MKKINIAELLKDCPTGMELDCPMFENLEFDRITKDKELCPIICCVKTEWGSYNVHTFTEYGCYSTEKYSKCVIFPKGKTTWEGFQRPFKDGDIVAVTMKPEGIWIGIFKQHKETSFESHCCLNTIGGFNSKGFKNHSFIGLRFATEEEKQRLFDAIKANGYKWNPETKTLEKLSRFKAGDIIKDTRNNSEGTILKVTDKGFECRFEYGNFLVPFSEQDHFDLVLSKSNIISRPKFEVGNRVKHISSCASGTIIRMDDKGYYIDCPKNGGVRYVNYLIEKDYELLPDKFDITTLKPFESKVLVRDYDNQIWIPTFWGKYLENDSNCRYLTTNGCYKYCIPYKYNYYLLGTTDDCDNFYKTWKK